MRTEQFNEINFILYYVLDQHRESKEYQEIEGIDPMESPNKKEPECHWEVIFRLSWHNFCNFSIPTLNVHIYHFIFTMLTNKYHSHCSAKYSYG